MALTEVAGLEEAYDEATRKEGKPTIEQQLAIQAAERIYIEREDIEIVADDWEPVETETDRALREAAEAHEAATSAAVDGAGVAG